VGQVTTQTYGHDVSDEGEKNVEPSKEPSKLGEEIRPIDLAATCSLRSPLGGGAIRECLLERGPSRRTKPKPTLSELDKRTSGFNRGE
jgi:hypothetical protein